MLTEEGDIYSFGCGSDGRLGHAESMDHKYLYREGFPKKIENIGKIKDFSASYYHNICINE